LLTGLNRRGFDATIINDYQRVGDSIITNMRYPDEEHYIVYTSAGGEGLPAKHGFVRVWFEGTELCHHNDVLHAKYSTHQRNDIFDDISRSVHFAYRQLMEEKAEQLEKADYKESRATYLITGDEAILRDNKASHREPDVSNKYLKCGLEDAPLLVVTMDPYM
jgi:hypothetical protein